MQGFGSKVLAFDIYPSEEMKALGVEYVSKEELLTRADVISLHCPLLPSTYHIIDKARSDAVHSRQLAALTTSHFMQ